MRRFGSVVRTIVVGCALLFAANARADVDPLKLADLGQKALRYYDDLDFARARATLEQALDSAKAGGLDQSAIAARLHLYLGLVLAAGLQKPEPASEQFKLAVKIDPTITPPEGLFNPEVTALFAAARGAVPAEPPAEAGDEPATEGAPKQAPADVADDDAETSSGEQAHGEHQADVDRATEPDEAKKPTPTPTDSNDDETIAGGASSRPRQHPFFGALGIGAGGGTASGHIDMKGVTPSTAPGGFAMSELGHVTLTAGYFWTPAWLFAVEARLQLVSGPTPHCVGSVCSDPSGFAAAVLAKASYFVGDGPFKLFGTGRLGAGSIRQIVKLNGLPDCGQSGNQQCFDTVTGGPVIVAAGGGAAYALGPVLLLGGLTANVAFPDFMLNVDLTVGAGVRF